LSHSNELAVKTGLFKSNADSFKGMRPEEANHLVEGKLPVRVLTEIVNGQPEVKGVEAIGTQVVEFFHPKNITQKNHIKYAGGILNALAQQTLQLTGEPLNFAKTVLEKRNIDPAKAKEIVLKSLKNVNTFFVTSN
jgi:hypothetical protein